MTQFMQKDDINCFGLEASVRRKNICIEFRGERKYYRATLVCCIGYRSPEVAEPETQLSNPKETEPETQLSNTKKKRMWHSCFPMMGRAPPSKKWSPSRILMDDTANEDAHYKCFCEALVNKMKNRRHDQCFLLVDKKWDNIQVIRKHCPYDLP